MSEHNELGKRGENIATEYLTEKGYIILDRNWKFKREEVDIIARDKEYYVFIEVKTRADDYFETPEKAVTRAKQKKIITVANEYIQSNDIEEEARFDIISIILKGAEEPKINHIEDAFYATL